MIVNHMHPKYLEKQARMRGDRFNGAFYYSKEITEIIIPLVDTDRNWITINLEGEGADHSIVFIHNNIRTGIYNWLQEYKDLILVCGIPETCEKVAHLGTPIYLPLSVDVEEVRRYIRPKTKRRALVGRSTKVNGTYVLKGTDKLMDMPRSELLRSMAEYREVYAVGRTAIEAKVLGCEVLPYDPRFLDPSRWEIRDSREAAELLQKELNKIDRKE